MFCLRSWLPLLFIPTNASPLFLISFFILTYLLNRPCVYCSILLLILFISSCYWSDQCFFDIHSNWFEPRHISSAIPNPLAQAGFSSGNGSSVGVETSFLVQAVNETASALAGAAIEGLKRRVQARSGWSGLRVPCVNFQIRL